MCDLYEVWAEKSMFGKKYMGVVRSTFIIDPEGRIAKEYEKVKVIKHSEDVLKTLGELHLSAS